MSSSLLIYCKTILTLHSTFRVFGRKTEEPYDISSAAQKKDAEAPR